MTVYVTHERLASPLGVRRAGITLAAGALQARGLIRYSRSSLTILDRTAPETAACGCFARDRRHHAKSMN